MTIANENAELAAAVKQLRLLLREDVLLRSDIACVDTVLAALASAQRDAAIVDWLEKIGGSLTCRAKERTRYDMGKFWEWSGWDEAYDGKTIRDAIDAAMKAITP